MDQTAKDVILVMVGIIVAGLSWWLKELRSEHRELRREFGEVVKNLPVNYASKNDVRDTEHRLNTAINKVETSIVQKVDSLGSDLKSWIRDLASKVDHKVDKK